VFKTLCVTVPVTFWIVISICRSTWWLSNKSIHQSREPINYLSRYQDTWHYWCIPYLNRLCILYFYFLCECSSFTVHMYMFCICMTYSTSYNNVWLTLDEWNVIYVCTGGGQNNGNIKKLRNTICVGYTERTSVANTERSSFVCLHSVVFVPVHWWLYWVTVHVKESENGSLV
jgi:hypothetical protein